MTMSDPERETAQDLVRRITAVFGVGKRPSGRDLIGPTDDEAGAQALRDLLSGRTWDQLSQRELAEHWASFCYLAPKGYRHYLPALLRAGLRALGDDPSLVHSVVFSLQPSYWHLYWRGADREHEARVATLAEPEVDLVCEFLAFMQQCRHPFLAAQALRWGWSVRETPHHAGMRAHYERMFGHTWPGPADPAAAAVAEQVARAFAGTPYPGDDRLCGSDLGDEPAEYALEFRGQDWRTLHPAFLGHNDASLSFFTPEGFRYYLPAYLLDDLHGGDTDPLFQLTHALDDPHAELHDHAVARVRDFDREQCEAVVAYLGWRHAIDEEYELDRKDIDRALAGYWLPRLTGSS